MTFKSANTANEVGLDQGVPWIERVQIQCNGQDIEDIQSYNRLHAILMDCQGSDMNLSEWSTLYHERQRMVQPTNTAGFNDNTDHKKLFERFNAAQNGETAAPAANEDATGRAIAQSTLPAAHNVADADGTQMESIAKYVDLISKDANAKLSAAYTHVDQMISGISGKLYNALGDHSGGLTYNFPLVSCLFNLEKYFPMIMVNQGIDVIFHLADAANVGVWQANDGNCDYTIQDVRFVAHEVQLDNTFYDRLRASVAASNGVLSMAGTTWRHYLNIIPNGSANGNADINIATRVKSLKALITRAQSNALVNNTATYSVGVGQNPFCASKAETGVTGQPGDLGHLTGEGSYQYRIGSVLYPATAVKVSAINIGEVSQEVRKLFGTVGDYTHGTLVNKTSSLAGVVHTGPTATAGANGIGNFVFGYDFEGFSKTATESGLNISDRALNVSMQLNLKMGASNGTNDLRLDTYAMCDCLIYVGLDGSVTSRI